MKWFNCWLERCLFSTILQEIKIRAACKSWSLNHNFPFKKKIQQLWNYVSNCRVFLYYLFGSRRTYSFNKKIKKYSHEIIRCGWSKFSGFEPTTQQIFDPTVAIALNRSSTFNSFKFQFHKTSKQKHKKTTIISKNQKIKTIIMWIGETLVCLIIIINCLKFAWF